jgi:hypothetical protein
MADVSNEDFTKAISLFRKGLDQGYLRLRFRGVSELPQLEIVNNTRFEEIQQEASIPSEIIKEVRRRKLPEMIWLILQEAENFYIQKQINELFDLEEDEEVSEEQSNKNEDEVKRKEIREQKLQARQKITDQLTLVREQIITQRIRQRFLLRRTASSGLISRCSGEIVKQLYHSLGDGPSLYATVVLLTERPGKNQSFFFPMGFPFGEQSERERVVLTCDENDLDTLIDTLTDIRDRLREQVKLEGKEHGSV